MVIGSNQRLHSFSDDQINIDIDGKLITKAKEAKSLGVIIGEHLSGSGHIDALSKKISSAIGALKRINALDHSSQRTLPSKSIKRSLHPTPLSIDYCSSIWGDCYLTFSDKLKKLQNTAARAITRSNYNKARVPF